MLETAGSMVSHVQPAIRRKAVQLLISLGQQCPSCDSSSSSSSSTVREVDAVFQLLSMVAVTDTLAQLRQEALEGLGGLHCASTVIKLQALSKKATMRVAAHHSAAAVDTTTARAVGGKAPTGQHPSAKRQKVQTPEQPQADSGLMDVATGALVHGTEDDIPRVRLAAVVAVVSLSNQDVLFADAAAVLLSDLVTDQLLEIRLAALQALLAEAKGFQHRRQQEQQHLLQHAGSKSDLPDAHLSQSSSPGATASLQELTDTVMTGGESKEHATEQQYPAFAASMTQPHRQARSSKPRTSDLPPWGKDVLLAAAAALSDRHPAVRQLSLQLLEQLPPANVPDLVAVIQGLALCCERFSDQDGHAVWALVARLGEARAQMITLAAGKLVSQLASFLAPLGAAAAMDYAAAGPLTSHVPRTGDSGGTAASPRASLHHCAVTVAGQAGGSHSSDGGGRPHPMPPGAQVLTALLLSGVQHRPQGLPTLMKELQKAGLSQRPVLQAWLVTIQSLEEQRQQ